MQKVVSFNGVSYLWSWWNGQRVKGTNEKPAAFDFETVAMSPARPLQEGESLGDVPPHPLSVPPPVVGMTYDGTDLYLIHTKDVDRYFSVNRSVPHVGHHVAFDFWSVFKHSNRSTQDALWQMAEGNRLRCSLVLDLVMQLATGVYRAGGKKKRGGGGDDDKVLPTSLAVLSEEFGVGELDKTDPYRLRFGELLGLSREEMESHPEAEGFFSYALRDAVATFEVYWRQREKAIELMRRAGFSQDRSQKVYEIRADAIDKWGPLSEAIQVRASITLAELSRTPLRIDQEARENQERQSRDRYWTAADKMLALRPDIFQLTDPEYRVDVVEVEPAVGRKKAKTKKVKVEVAPGVIDLNDGSGLPKVNKKALKDQLAKEAAALGIDPPLSDGKLKGVSEKAHDWEEYRDRSPFLAAWMETTTETKLLSFFLSLRSNDGNVYANYELLKKSGRTSATGHRDVKGVKVIPSANVQQIPKENEDDPERDVRKLFLAPKGCKWLTVDYKAIEMATLAASCVARFGKSRLREVIRDNVLHGAPDPHQITAAAIQREPVTDFLRRDPHEQKKRRKEAKEVSFGYPGGMGVRRFCLSTSRKGIHFTAKQAREAKKAWMDSYPELYEHLADHTELALAWQTGLPVSKVPKLSWLQRKRYSEFLRGSAELTPGEKETFFEIVATLGRAKKSEEIVQAAEERKLIPAMKRLFEYRSCTLTGRVRNNCTFCSAANGVFQGLAADGAKEAIFYLMRRGVKVIMFVHDELSIAAPAAQAKAILKQVETAMVKCMEDVIGHDVPVAVESGIGDRWTKG